MGGDVAGRAGGSLLILSTPNLSAGGGGVGEGGRQCYVTPCVRVFGDREIQTLPSIGSRKERRDGLTLPKANRRQLVLCLSLPAPLTP